MPEIKITTDDLLSFSEAARILKVTRMTVYAMIGRGELHPFRLAENRFLHREEVERLRDEKHQKGGDLATKRE